MFYFLAFAWGMAEEDIEPKRGKHFKNEICSDFFMNVIFVS
jgi:hypothetical protein